MPWTLGDVTAESVSSTSVDSTAVSANSITIQGSPVYAKRTIVITGMFRHMPADLSTFVVAQTTAQIRIGGNRQIAVDH